MKLRCEALLRKKDRRYCLSFYFAIEMILRNKEPCGKNSEPAWDIESCTWWVEPKQKRAPSKELVSLTKIIMQGVRLIIQIY